MNVAPLHTDPLLAEQRRPLALEPDGDGDRREQRGEDEQSAAADDDDVEHRA